MGTGTKVIIVVLIMAFIVLPLIFFIVSLAAYNKSSIPMEAVGSEGTLII